MTTSTVPDQHQTHLAADEIARAWTAAFRHSLDLHGNAEVAWEAGQWRRLGAPSLAEMCDELLRERESDAFVVPSDCTAADLAALWAASPRAEVLELVRSGALNLTAAMRVVFWLREWSR